MLLEEIRLGYEVKYFAEKHSSSSLKKFVRHPTAALTSLKPFTFYTITITAKNANGYGPPSDTVNVRTNEAGWLNKTKTR